MQIKHRERLLVFVVGVVAGTALGLTLGRSLYYGVGYDVFKNEDAFDTFGLDPGLLSAEGLSEEAQAILEEQPLAASPDSPGHPDLAP